jgi:hypothetical protein
VNIIETITDMRRRKSTTWTDFCSLQNMPEATPEAEENPNRVPEFQAREKDGDRRENKEVEEIGILAGASGTAF